LGALDTSPAALPRYPSDWAVIVSGVQVIYERWCNGPVGFATWQDGYTARQVFEVKKEVPIKDDGNSDSICGRCQSIY